MARTPETIRVTIFQGTGPNPGQAGKTTATGWWWNSSRGARKTAGGLEPFARRATARRSVDRFFAVAGSVVDWSEGDHGTLVGVTRLGKPAELARILTAEQRTPEQQAARRRRSA